MVKFIYNMKENLIPLIRETIPDCESYKMIGYVDEGDLSNVNNLKNSSLYLVAELDTINDEDIYKNPLVLVSRNQQRAVEMFNEVTGKVGSVVAEIEHNCDKLKVEPA